MTTWRRSEWMVLAGMLAVSAATPQRMAAAQSPPPVQGTIALEGTMNKFYRGANVMIVTTIDGVEHAYRFTRDLVVHGGKTPDVSALEGLSQGSTVVVHYTVQGAEQDAREVDVVGAEGLEIAEGVVTRVDRGRGEITVRYSNGRAEAFKLTERATAEAGSTAPAGTKVTIYYSDEHGHKVAHFFKKVAK